MPDTVTAPEEITRFAMLGNHMPRHCGIATFTTHLADALTEELPDADGLRARDERCRPAARLSASRPVRDQRRRLASYRRAADFLNVNRVDVLSVQHEYGIFGGKAGAHLLALLRELRMPIVTTLHTILSAPNPAQRAVIDELARLSTRLVVMSAVGAELLKRVHGMPDDQIDLIPHGIPARAGRRQQQGPARRRGEDGDPDVRTALARQGHRVRHRCAACDPRAFTPRPSTSSSAPRIRMSSNAKARPTGSCSRRAVEQLGVAKKHDLPQPVRQPGRTDASSCRPPTSTSRRICRQSKSHRARWPTPSGPGKAVISTPYIYARELLADGRGVLVPWRDCGGDRARGHRADGRRRASVSRMCARAAAYGVGMTWPAVARRYVESFARARAEDTRRRRTSFHAQTLASRPAGSARDQPEARSGA